MDKVALGLRVANARGDTGMTQDGLGRAVSLDRTAIASLEKGERALNVPELVEIARVLGYPLSYFVNAPLPTVVSRRREVGHTHDSTRALDTQLEQFAADVGILLQMGLIDPAQRSEAAQTPQNHGAAERMAGAFRRRLEEESGPLQDLGAACQRLGLCTYSAALGEGGPDGGCVEVGDTRETLGAAVINGDAPSGRRRMTLAHELGHWLSEDAYDSQASVESEKMINSFAIHFLAPRAGVSAHWDRNRSWPLRDRALSVGALFRLSWSATVGQLRNLDLIAPDEYRMLMQDEPRAGDYVRLGLSWTDELASPYVSPGFAAASVNGYVSGRLTADRSIELLRGTLTVEGLPRQAPTSLEDLRGSFAGHGG